MTILQSTNAHLNIRPCWWGPQLWQTIFFVIATYPENPTPEHIESVKCFFKSLKLLLPCEGCQTSYAKFSAEPDTNINDNSNFKSRAKLIRFTHKLRDKVNGKLAHEYSVSLNYFEKKLASMVMSEANKYDGRVCEMIEAPFFSQKLEKMAFTYLKSNHYDVAYTKKLLEISKKFMENPIFSYDNKIFRFMYRRHKKCRKLIAKIYHNMGEGKYDAVQSFVNYDSELHCKLLSMGCSILHSENLESVLSLKDSSKKKH